jgi:hypothetical protein
MLLRGIKEENCFVSFIIQAFISESEIKIV